MRIYLLISLLVTTLLPGFAPAQSMFDESLRELEVLRLRQLQTVQDSAEILPFTSDGCSGNLSRSWQWFADALPEFKTEFGQQPPWEDCCVAHDRVYWRGRVVDGYAGRAQADAVLRQCVLAKGDDLAGELSVKFSVSEARVKQGFTAIADLMHRAVRIGGQPCSLLSWRWGYGWPSCALAAPGKITAEYSAIEADENLVFFNTAAWLNPAGTHWRLPLHAWIYEPADSNLRRGLLQSILESTYALEVTPASRAHFDRRTNLLLADNERGKRLVVRLAGRDYALPLSAENGQVYAEIELSVEVVNALANGARLDLFAVTRAGELRRFQGQVQLLAPYGISLISDIDDTVKITHVGDRKKLFRSTFIDDFSAVEGMSELYRRLAARGVNIHFVSSSPWQLYPPLSEFITAAGFPWATYHLKNLRFRDETLLNLLKPGIETKPAQIEPILERFPARQFVLVGDSGEQDPEVYAEMARRYPTQIIKILIRNVDGSSAADPRYKAAFAGIAPGKWQLFDTPAQIELELGSN